ncbi:MAG: AAA family ATPase [Terriglobales bacterium]
MAEVSVAILALDDEPRTVLQMQVNATTIARTVGAINTFPVGATDQLLRRLSELNPDVILIDIPPANSALAIRAIELLHHEMAKASIFAVGDLSQPQLIVNAMRAGAREFLERPTSTASLLEAFARVAQAQRKSTSGEQRGKIITVMNAKGGNGATTVAVNTALSLQLSQGDVALVDMATIGNAALHLNARPSFTIVDVFHNLHRLDASLLESFMVRHPQGLHLLAGATTPVAEVGSAEIARLFDSLTLHYRYVIVDASSRLDASTRLIAHLSNIVLLVAHTDVTSLWSASHVRQYLDDSGATQRIRLVLNRFRKIPGFSESDAETAVGAKLLWKIPNNFPAVSAAIDHGIPVIEQNQSDISRAFAGLATALTEVEEKDTKRKSWSLFKTA